jgi:hypothetical protein
MIDGRGGIPNGGGVIMQAPVGDRKESDKLLMCSDAFVRVCPYRCAEDYTLIGYSEGLTLRSVTSKYLEQKFSVAERPTECYLETGPVRVPFVTRHGVFVFLAQRRPCPSAGGIYTADGPNTAQRALTEQTGDSSMGIPVEFLADESRIAETLPAQERSSEQRSRDM